MPKAVILFVRSIDAINRAVGKFSQYLVFGMMGVLLFESISSLEYAQKYGQVNYTSWAPPLAPIKIIMTIGIVLMLLQAIAILFKDLATVRGESVE